MAVDQACQPRQERPVPIIDPELCTGCGLCVRVCPTQALALNGQKAVVADPGRCDYHGLCELICPFQAISRPFVIIFEPLRSEPMQPLHLAHWQEKIVFSPDGPQPQTIFGEGDLKVVIAGLEAGQQISPHPEGIGIYHFLEGNGWMTVDSRRMAVAAGATVVAPQDALRSIEAKSRLAFLAARVTAPSSG